MTALIVQVPDDIYEELTARHVVVSDVVLLALRAELQRQVGFEGRESPATRNVSEWSSTCAIGPLITPAESRVLTHLATHLTLAEIGERLYLSRTTVKSHVASVYAKLNVNTRSAAVERLALLPDDVPAHDQPSAFSQQND